MPEDIPDVVGVGLVTLDQIGLGPRSRDPAVELTAFSLQAGGPTGTALATMAAFGAKAKYFGRLGNDAFGEIIQRRLRSFGVDTSAVLLESGRLSPVSFTMLEDDNGRRYVRYTRGDTTPLAATDLPPTLFDQVRLLYVDGEMPAAQIVAAERARARGARVILGIRRMGPGLGELLDLADAVVASERVAAEIAHSSDMERSLVELTKMGPDIAVVTLGEDGAIGLHENKLVRQQALTVKIVDVTGAGSVFRGAFAYALLQDWPLERAIPFANAAAGLNCTSLGGQGGIPTLEAVERAAAS
ncbi:MAG: PfkB family carbohydrate kinase [Polyangia bacterium]